MYCNICEKRLKHVKEKHVFQQMFSTSLKDELLFSKIAKMHNTVFAYSLQTDMTMDFNDHRIKI